TIRSRERKSRRSRSREKREKSKKDSIANNKQMDDDLLNIPVPEDEETMKKLLGFGSFDST
uniref:U4/U6.U5 tri-snRNP-associated protein 3 n=1 Tax=Romanomermis culicivorax TaxID=13658 RepID=A0A915JN75_ROMCU